jgi:hypothetical protein
MTSITKQMTIVTLRNLPGPEWRSTVLIDVSGLMFICYDATGRDEEEVLARAEESGLSLPDYKGHPYFPIAWLISEFPKSRENCEVIERFVRARIAQ